MVEIVVDEDEVYLVLVEEVNDVMDVTIDLILSIKNHKIVVDYEEISQALDIVDVIVDVVVDDFVDVQVDIANIKVV